MNILEKDFEYYLKNQTNLVKKFPNKYLVIKDQNVVGAFESELEAYEESSKKYELGTFLIQLCSAGNEGHSQTFYSRVNFS